MRSSKRLLSLLTASALAVSAFSGVAVSAGAEEFETPVEEMVELYDDSTDAVISEDFSDVADTWGFTTDTGVSIADGVLNLCTSNNSAKTDTKDFDDTIKNMAGVNLSFKWKTGVDLTSGSNRQSVFKLLDDEGNIIFAISGAANRSGIPSKVRYQVGGEVTTTSTSLADSNDWFDVNLKMDFANKTVEGTIAQGDNKVTISKTAISANCLAQLAAQNVSSLAPMAIDDVVITKGDVSPVTFKVTSSNENAPIENAQIIVAGFGAVTNASGEAVIDLPDGEYKAQITAAQHRSAEVDVKVEGSAADIPVEMEYVGQTAASRIVISGGEEKIYKPAEGENKTTVPFTATIYDTIDQVMEDETVTWSIPDNIEGISIDENGIVTVTNAIKFADKNGLDVKIRATSNSVSSVYAETTIHVNDIAEVTSFDIVGPKVVKDKSSAQYSVANVRDQYDVEMETYGTPVITASEGIAVDNMTITPSLGVTNETSATVTITIDGKSVTKDITVYGYDFYEPGKGEASIGDPRMEEINGVKMIVWPASTASATSTYTMALPNPVALENGTSKMLTFNTYYYDKSGNHKDVTVQERTMLIKNSKGDTIARFGFANGTMYVNPTYDSKDGVKASDASWVFNAEGVENSETVLFSTDMSGVTKVTVQVNGGDTYTYEAGTDLGEIASIELFEGKGAPSDRMQALTNVKITDSDIVPVEINGDNFISKIYGTEATKQYTASIFAQEEGETFSWSCAPVGNEQAVLSEDSTEAAAVLNPTKTGAAKAVTAIYADGRLESVSTQDINVTAGEAVKINAPEGATVMLWNSLNEMEPMAEAVVASATEQPTNPPSEPTNPPTEPTNPPTEPTNPPESDIYIDEDGILHVPYTTTATAVEIRYSSNLDESKYATKIVEIRDYANIKSFDINGPAAIATGETGTYSVSNITDEYGDVVEMAPKYSIQSGSEYASIDPSTGVLTTTASGKVTIAVTVGNPGKELTLTKDVTVANFYYVNKEVSGDSIVVDASSLANYTADTEYYVTTAADGEIISQETTKAIDGKITVSTEGATAVEVSPVYSYTNGVSLPLEIPMPDGFYDFTFTKSNGDRADIFVNGNMVGQNVDQYGRGRVTNGSTYSVSDVKVSGGSAVVTMDASAMSSVTAKKAPSIVERKQHVYILGDSLVSNYYGTFADEDGDGIPAPGDAQTGWGQVLDKFIKDSVNVTNLAESGNYAQGLYDTTFHSVIANSEPGDVLLFECGYNDRSYPASMSESARVENMKHYMELVYNESKAAGLTIVFVTPNGTPRGDGWRENNTVAVSGSVVEKCIEMDAPYIDLAGLSTAINKSLGETEEEAKAYVNANYIVNGDDLHSSYLGAMRHALTVAQAMYGMDELKDLVDTEASYNMVDSKGETQEFKVVTTN